jgi:hypothetical protein
MGIESFSVSANYNADLTAGTSSSLGKISGSGPTGVMLYKNIRSARLDEMKKKMIDLPED